MNNNQVIRFDGKNCFIEVLVSGLAIGKVQVNFIEYDLNKEQKNRVTKNIAVYIDRSEALYLAHFITSKEIKVSAKETLETQKKGGYKYCLPVYVLQGGTSAEKLKKQGKARKDGLAEARIFKITPGDKKPFVLSAETGPGKENETGLIMPQYKMPEKRVIIPFEEKDLIKFAEVIRVMAEYSIKKQIEEYEKGKGV